MTLHAATKATVLLAASLLLAPPALAGDRAEFNALGYSADGRYFAFEEFGMQDGSGFPYSSIFVIDLPADGWAPGTPVRVRLEDMDATVATARQQAADEVAPKLEALGITEAARPLALNGDGDVEAIGYGLAFGTPGYGLNPVENEQTLTLDVFDLPSSQDCAVIDSATKGFALVLDGTEIVRDTGPLPKSRGCPMDYRIYAVIGPAEWVNIAAARVAIVSVYPFGFEGPDRRFIAVPLGQ